MKATTERQPLLWFRRPNRSSVFALGDCTVDFLHDLGLFIWVCHLLFSARGWKGSWTKAIKPVLDQRKQKGGNTAVFRAACLQWFHNLWISLSCRHLQRAITQADSVCLFFCGWFVCLFLNQEFTVRGINNILSIWVTWKNRGRYDQHGKKGTKCIHSSRITFLKTSSWEHKLVSGNETNLWCESDSEVWGTKIEAESCCDHKPAKSVNNMNQWLKTLRLPNLQLFTDFQSYCTAPILSDYTEK